MGGKGTVAIIKGDLAQNATHDRTEGVKQVLKGYPDIKIVEEQSAEWQRNKGMDLTSNWLLAGTDFDAVIANNDEMAIGAAMALQQAGKGKGEIPVVGIDGLPDGLAAIKRGLLAASVFQDPKAQSTQAIVVALKMIKGEPVEAETWVPFKLITPDQVAVYEQRFK
jgi:inositol transport system substrate-binding protein